MQKKKLNLKNESISYHLKKLIAKAVNAAFEGQNLDSEAVAMEHPTAEEHGDYSTNIALRLHGQISGAKNPREIAEAIVAVLQQSTSASVSKDIKKIEVAGAGFVNFTLSKNWQVKQVEQVLASKEAYGRTNVRMGKKIMVEFAHPNTHKEMHIGHMRTLITGEALARIFEFSGAKVFRANYQGDIGPHVAKAIWGTTKILEEKRSDFEEAEKLSLKDKAHLLGQGYIRGNQEYENHKAEIDKLNGELYQKEPAVWGVYERTRKWSTDYYKAFYERFYTKFDRLYFESEVALKGKEIVRQNVGRVFTESDGAVIFDGEKFGLHKRVFVTQDGNPTYEGKEMALGPLQFADFPFDLNVHVVASEQAGYFQVVIKALEQLNPKFIGREFHLSMGMVQLVGRKISSRTGVLVTVDGLIEDVKELLKPKLHSEDFNEKEKEEVLEAATIGAVKYSVLKSGPLMNATFDLEKSVSLEGDSGPYLQYTYARARSVLRKANQNEVNKVNKISNNITIEEFNNEEMAILRWLYRFPEVVEQAARNYSPNLICSYLFEAAKRFNNFYNEVPILGASLRSSPLDKLGTAGLNIYNFRLALTEATSIVIKNGLNLLGIEALERM